MARWKSTWPTRDREGEGRNGSRGSSVMISHAMQAEARSPTHLHPCWCQELPLRKLPRIRDETRHTGSTEARVVVGVGAEGGDFSTCSSAI